MVVLLWVPSGPLVIGARIEPKLRKLLRVELYGWL